MNELDKIYKRIDELTDIPIKEFRGYTVRESVELASLNAQAQEMEEQKAAKRGAEKQEKSQEMKRRRARGKYGERRLARKTGGVADGRPHKEDVRSSMFSYESKYIKEAPKWLQKVMTEAIRLSRQGTIPVAHIRDRTNRLGYFITMEQDWIELHGEKEK